MVIPNVCVDIVWSISEGIQKSAKHYFRVRFLAVFYLVHTIANFHYVRLTATSYGVSWVMFIEVEDPG